MMIKNKLLSSIYMCLSPLKNKKTALLRWDCILLDGTFIEIFSYIKLLEF